MSNINIIGSTLTTISMIVSWFFFKKMLWHEIVIIIAIVIPFWHEIERASFFYTKSEMESVKYSMRLLLIMYYFILNFFVFVTSVTDFEEYKLIILLAIIHNVYIAFAREKLKQL